MKIHHSYDNHLTSCGVCTCTRPELELTKVLEESNCDKCHVRWRLLKAYVGKQLTEKEYVSALSEFLAK